MKCCIIIVCLLFVTACSHVQDGCNNSDTAAVAPIDSLPYDSTQNVLSKANSTAPQQVVNYSTTLVGIPYKYASTDPAAGFDCSGFVTYVFNHFGIEVPRSSVEFTNAYPEVAANRAKPGDLILFTGTDSAENIVGHMGIITSNINDSITFIHATSGKAFGVTLTPLNTYYKSRFVKIVRVLPQND